MKSNLSARKLIAYWIYFIKILKEDDYRKKWIFNIIFNNLDRVTNQGKKIKDVVTDRASSNLNSQVNLPLIGD